MLLFQTICLLSELHLTKFTMYSLLFFFFCVLNVINLIAVISSSGISWAMQICNRPPSTRFPSLGVTRSCTLETLSLCSAFEKRLLSCFALNQLPIKLQILMSQLIFAIFCKYINHYLHLTYYYHLL